ncbi:MAG: VanZ family protein [Lachnospiraceae bacterium]|nr:VanZ family protein [Lachnospiraceae bacterium]
MALTFAVMVMIFWFSAQSADESSNLSGRFLAWIMSGKVPFLTRFAETTRIFEWLNIRKCAHAFVYFLLGVCAALSAGTEEWPGKKQIGVAWLFCVLYAGSDELHQFFVPGRSCEFRDVMIDSSGALTGVLLVFLIRGLRRIWLSRRGRPSEVRTGE